MTERLWANPALAEWTRPETRAPAQEIARASIARELEFLVRNELPEQCPPEDLAAARAAVAYGAPVTVVLQCYRAGHAALWDAWHDAVEEVSAPQAAPRPLLDAGSDFLFAYVDRCAGWVEREHAREHERGLRGAEQRRMHMVLGVLEGDSGDEEVLGYRLDLHHLAVIAWGAEPEVALRGLEVGLAVSADPQTSWGWLGSARPFGPQALAAASPPRETWLAVGGPAHGPDGFRRAHAEARDAQRVARRRPAPVTRFADIGLEALGATDERRARDFVLRELGELAGGGAREQVMRATLAAYFASGQNAASAAARLGVHERMIANRLRAVEARLGRPVITRRAELEMALRLRELLEF
jgi:hypothetical protein